MADASDVAGVEAEGPPLSAAESIAFLRARGVEVDLPEERGAARAGKDAAAPAGPSFTFVCIPADTNVPVSVESAASSAGTDVLKRLLRSRFADDAAMDEATVTRETAARMQNMLHSGSAALKAPNAAAMAAQAAGGACEAYPLAQASDDNGGRAVRLYIDEVGALRARPRNPRAEALAAAVGLAGLSIHGDAYVGRCERVSAAAGPAGFGETNVPFGLAELAPGSEWATAARRAHERTAARAGHGDTEHLASGDGGSYSWSQTEDEVEVRVRGAPAGKGAARRVTVGYARGESLAVAFDGQATLQLSPLFARTLPDESTWTLDGGEVVVTLPKGEPRPWAMLTLPAA